MNKLPPEILKLVFDHLHYSQKLQCKLVCREWAYVLQSGSDIESVAIPLRTDEKARSHVHLPFIEKVRNGILNGENCRRLILHDHYYPDRALLAKLFPNLKLIHFPSQATPSVELTPERIGYLQNWQKSLETYMDSSYDETALNIFDSGVFQKLTTIKLLKKSYSQVRLITLADKLKNAPNLKKLDLYGFQVDIIGLEKLHSNVPCLESLVLRYCAVELPRELSKVIQPEKTMREFALIECFYNDGFTLSLSQYIVRIYSSLERFSLIIDDGDYDELNDLQENPIHYIIQTLAHTLQALNTNAFCRSPNSLIELTNNATFLEELTADVNGEMSLLTPILESDTLTNTLRLLSLYHMPSINFKVFNRFCHLKQLCVSFEFLKAISQPIELNVMIKVLPKSLVTLQLEYVGLCLSQTYVNDCSALPIKSLTMKHCRITSDLSGYLSHCFPKLKTLVIVCCETQFHLELPNHNLSFVEFHLYPSRVSTTFKNERKKGKVSYHSNLFKLTANGNTPTFYEHTMQGRFQIVERWTCESFDKHDRLQYDIRKPITLHHKESEMHYFHFRCASVQTLLLNRELIL